MDAAAAAADRSFPSSPVFSFTYTHCYESMLRQPEHERDYAAVASDGLSAKTALLRQEACFPIRSHVCRTNSSTDLPDVGFCGIPVAFVKVVVLAATFPPSQSKTSDIVEARLFSWL